jgi:parallel beta-helix repeat protein
MKRILILILSVFTLNVYSVTYTVTNTNDAGAGSLRNAIISANGSVGADIINFTIPGPYKITLSSALTIVTDPVTINGYSQAGSGAGTPLIEIDGATFGNGVLEIQSGGNGSVISGLIIYGAPRGIYLNGSSSNTIKGCYIGTNATGTAVGARLITLNGIQVDNGINNNIGGIGLPLDRNIISSCSQTGIYFSGTCTGTVIINNYIGLNKAGTLTLPNSQHGIFNTGNFSNSKIGGSASDSINVISGNGFYGIYISASTNVQIVGNYIGTDATGNVGKGNGQHGIGLNNSSNNCYITSNVISSNSWDGINLNSSTGCTINGNKIGLGLNGTTALGNLNDGILLDVNSTGVIIGGTTAANRNIISSNSFYGITMAGTSTGGVIKGNYIGTDATGLIAKSNGRDGININGCSTTTIGGTTAGSGNVISSNSWNGVYISGSINCVIKGNTIGLGSDGSTVLGNISASGIVLVTNSTGTIIGGTTANERNIISGNIGNGINLSTSGGSSTIQGNYIGVDVTGNIGKGNGSDGILVNNSSSCTIGGTAIGSGNVISKNTGNGVKVISSTSTTIQNNIVGLGDDGSTSLGNTSQGIRLEGVSSNSTIGGVSSTSKNIVSSNSGIGIYIETSLNCFIQGNYVGTTSTGLVAKGNGSSGISVNVSSTNVTIGGTSTNFRNIVCSNTGNGIEVNTSTNSVIKGNYVGLGLDGSTSLSNTGNGISLASNSTTGTVGGTSVDERNLVSSNGSSGISIANSNNVTVQGNFVGVDVTGLICRGNAQSGIYISASTGCVIGGSSIYTRNIISCNASDGISITNTSTTTTVKSNFIGLFVNGSGTPSTGNVGQGILISSTNSCIIGGTTLMERNVIGNSGNHALGSSGDAMRLLISSSNTIKGNWCGTDSTGLIAMQNEWSGLSLNATSNSSLVGGATQYERNIFSKQKNEGVYINNSSSNLFYGNYIGVGSDGVTPMGNEDFGVNISGTSTDNVFGGGLSRANTIANNWYGGNTAAPGFSIVQVGSLRNKITFNKIYCNGGVGILTDGVSQEGITSPVIISSGANIITGTAGNNDSIHVYRNTTSGTGCGCEGEIYVGTTKANGVGSWTLNHGLGLNVTDAKSVTATQNTSNLSTSPFTPCSSSLPVTFSFFNAFRNSDLKVNLEWETKSETNADKFEVLRSCDGEKFEVVGIVLAHGNSSSPHQYLFTDEVSAKCSVLYYQLNEIDYDGKSELSILINLKNKTKLLNIVKVGDKLFEINYTGPINKEIIVKVITVDGKEVYNFSEMSKINKESFIIEVPNLSCGFYLFILKINLDIVLIKKIIID